MHSEPTVRLLRSALLVTTQEMVEGQHTVPKAVRRGDWPPVGACRRRTAETVRCWFHGAWLDLAGLRTVLPGRPFQPQERWASKDRFEIFKVTVKERVFIVPLDFERNQLVALEVAGERFHVIYLMRGGFPLKPNRSGVRIYFWKPDAFLDLEIYFAPTLIVQRWRKRCVPLVSPPPEPIISVIGISNVSNAASTSPSASMDRGRTIVFIDNSNIFSGQMSAGWRLDAQKFKEYLERGGKLWQVFSLLR